MLLCNAGLKPFEAQPCRVGLIFASPRPQEPVSPVAWPKPRPRGYSDCRQGWFRHYQTIEP